jgi:hypothetical protein
MACIVYRTEENYLAVMYPNLDIGMTIEEIAAKDVPVGVAWEIAPNRPSRDYDWVNGEWVLAPVVAPVPASISFAQLMIGLVTEGFITEAEGDAWLVGTLPAAVLLVIDGLPADQRFAAKVRAIRPSEVLRSDPLVAAMNVAAGKTDEELDQFFRTYAGV